MSRRSILIALVLYGHANCESPSLTSLVRILGVKPALAKYLSLVIYDNSPLPTIPKFQIECPVVYKHDPSNPGLAQAYNFALRFAEREEYEWLLLLDQDTSLTERFFSELTACTELLQTQGSVASIVPKLQHDGTIYSPALHFIDQLRHQYRRSNHAVSRDTVGVQQGRLSAYNSGGSFRVSALRPIGGFPGEYWLDYLDHAVFHALAAHGYAMYVMRTEIKHDMSQAAVGNVSAWRQRNLISAQTMFVRQTGNVIDRLLYRIWLLRYCRIFWIRHPDRNLWK